MKISPASLVNLTIPKVAVAQHVEDRHQNRAEHDLPRDGLNHFGPIILRQRDLEHPFQQSPQVRLYGWRAGPSVIMHLC
jgi:hypothetical protein